MTSPYKTPLRYPGGKSKLQNFMTLLFQVNELNNIQYVEPYAGGASIALHLLFCNYVKHIHINDLDPSVHAFWHCVIEDTDNLCRLIYDTPVTIQTWEKQKSIQDNPDEHTTLELGFSTFFLNRTNRSGIITGGVIGGNKQDGKWKLDARYNKPALVSRIEQIAMRRDRITLYNQDAAQLITQVIPKLPKNTFVYLDPPYYLRSKKSSRLYQNFYQHDDHSHIARLVTKMRRKWVVSYDDTPVIRELYQGYKTIAYKLNYSAADRYQGSEIMFFCNSLSIPDVQNPAKVKNTIAARPLF